MRKYILPDEKDYWYLKPAGVLLWFLLKCLAVGAGIAAMVIVIKVALGL